MAGWLTRASALAVAFVASGWLANLAARPPSVEVPIWPPTGIALAALLVGGYRLWPGLFVGAGLTFLLEAGRYAPDLDPAAVFSGVFLLATAYTVQGLAGAWLIRRRLGPNPALHTPRAILYFLAVAGPVHCGIAATLSAPVLCVFDVKPWSEFWPTWVEWWWNDAVGGAVFAPVTLTLIGRPRGVWRSRRWTVGLPLLLAAGLLTAAYTTARTADDRAAQDRLDDEAEQTTAVLTTQLAALRSGLEGLRASYQLDQCLTDKKAWDQAEQGMSVFRAANPAVRTTGLLALVPADQLSRFEAVFRAAPGTGQFRISGPGGGRPAAAGKHAIVVRIAPLRGSRAVIGYDAYADPARWGAIGRAEVSGQVAATAPIRLLQTPDAPHAIVLFAPVYESDDRPRVVGRVVGFVAASVERERLIAAAASGRAPDSRFDLAGAVAPRAVAPAGGAAAVVSFEFGGERWQVRATAGPGYVATHRGHTAGLAGVAGCGLAFLLATLLLTITGQTGLVRAEVAARTADLQQMADAREFTALGLRASEARLADAQRTARLGSWEWDSLADEVTGTDELARITARYHPGKPPLAEFLTAFHPDDRRLIEAVARATVPSGDRAEFEARVVHPDGEVRWTLCTVAVGDHGIGVTVRGTIQDVTERKAAEARNQVHNLTARLLAEATDLGQAMPAVLEAVCQAAGWSVGEFWQPDPAGETLRLASTWSAADFTEFLSAGRASVLAPGEGVPGRAWVTGRPQRLTDLSDPGTCCRPAESVADRLRSALSYPILTAERTVGVFSFASDRPRDMSAVDLDMLRAVGEQVAGWVERTAAEERVRLSELRLRTLLDRSHDVIAVLDLTGHYRYLSPSLARLTGHPHEWLAAGDPFQIVHPDDVPAARAVLTETLTHPGKVVRCEVRCRTAAGGWVWMEAIGLDQTANPAVGGVVMNARDVTGRKQAERERQRYVDALQQTQRMDSLGALAGGVAHDFNNLLTGVLGNASLARELLPPEDDLHDYLRPIEQAAEQAAQLCQQMLAYAGRGGAVREAVDLNRLLDESADLLRLAAGKRVIVKVVPAADLPLFEADPGQLRQVVLNLVQNATEATGPDGGTVVIRTGTDTEGGRGKAEEGENPSGPPSPFPLPPSLVWVEVADAGCGMDEATRGRMFEPFFTTKFTGRGLGLSAVHGIVRRHGGDIRVTTAPGLGTTVRVYLPVGEVRPDPPTDHEPTTDSDMFAKQTVLVADNEPAVRELAAQTVRRMGFEVAEAADGAAAVDLLAADPGRFAVAVLDVTMPNMSGPTALAELRRLRPDLPAVLMSGYGAEELSGLPTDPVLRFLAKPFRPSELTKCVQAAVGGECGS